MSEMANFFNKLQNKYSECLHTILLAQIVKYDKDALRADLKPLTSINKVNLPLMTSVPFCNFASSNFIMHIPPNIGDIVVVLIAEHDIDNILLGSVTTDKNTERMKALDDAIIVGKLNTVDDILPTIKLDEIFIGAVTEALYIKMNKASNEMLLDATKIKIGLNATEGIPKGTMLKQWLDNHSHGTNGKPTTVSPSPSNKGLIE